MNKESLADYVGRHGQTETARRAGLTQGAIWQMLKSDRQIYVVEESGEDAIQLHEIRPIRRRTITAA